MSKFWTVTLPIAGYVELEVIADTRGEAIEKAFSADPNVGELYWDTYEHIVQGNVLQAPLNSPSAIYHGSSE